MNRTLVTASLLLAASVASAQQPSRVPDARKPQPALAAGTIVGTITWNVDPTIQPWALTATEKCSNFKVEACHFEEPDIRKSLRAVDGKGNMAAGSCSYVLVGVPSTMDVGVSVLHNPCPPNPAGPSALRTQCVGSTNAPAQFRLTTAVTTKNIVVEMGEPTW